jgi:hypothetical protein
MLPKIKLELAFGLLTLVFGLQSLTGAQESTAKTLETDLQRAGRSCDFGRREGR